MFGLLASHVKKRREINKSRGVEEISDRFHIYTEYITKYSIHNDATLTRKTTSFIAFAAAKGMGGGAHHPSGTAWP